MLGTAINLTTARILNLAYRDQSNFDSHKFQILADDLKDRLKRLGDPKLFYAYAERIDAAKTRDEYIKLCKEVAGDMRRRGFNESKVTRVEAFTRRMAAIDQRTCRRFYSALVGDYDIITIDREAKMRTTVKSFDESGIVPPLFKQDGSGNLQTYTDKNGRVRYKINRGALDFDNFNRLAKFLKDKGLKIHVNALIWHEEVPQQIKNLAESDLPPAEKKRRCEDFLYAYINEFAKNARENGISLSSVEVLNEIVDDDNPSVALRDSVFRELLGDDYFVQCYEMAKEAFDQDTKLFYNDYSEFDPTKKSKILSVIKALERAEREKGAPLLDGVGLQCHLYGDDYDYDSAIKEYLSAAKSGFHPKEVRITEIDSADCNNPSWQREQMKRCLDAAANNGLETVSCWSDISPFVDHLESTSNIGLLSPDGQTTELHEDLKTQYLEKEKENTDEKTLTKPSSGGGQGSGSGGESGDNE